MKHIRPVTAEEGAVVVGTSARTVSAIINIATLTNVSFITDELEDFLSIKIKKAMLYVDVKAANLASALGASCHEFAYICPVIVECETAGDHPTRADDAWAEDPGDVESYVNSKCGDDRKRTIRVLPGKFMSWREQVYWNSQTNAVVYNHFVYARLSIDITEYLKETIAQHNKSVHSTDIRDYWVCTFVQHSPGATLTGTQDAILVVDFDLVQPTRSKLKV